MTTQTQTQTRRIDNAHNQHGQFQAPGLSLAVAAGCLAMGLVGWMWNLVQPGGSSLDAFLLIAVAFLLQGIVGHLQTRPRRNGRPATSRLSANRLSAVQFQRFSQARWN